MKGVCLNCYSQETNIFPCSNETCNSKLCNDCLNAFKGKCKDHFIDRGIMIDSKKNNKMDKFESVFIASMFILLLLAFQVTSTNIIGDNQPGGTGTCNIQNGSGCFQSFRPNITGVLTDISINILPLGTPTSGIQIFIFNTTQSSPYSPIKNEIVAQFTTIPSFTSGVYQWKNSSGLLNVQFNKSYAIVALTSSVSGVNYRWKNNDSGNPYLIGNAGLVSSNSTSNFSGFTAQTSIDDLFILYGSNQTLEINSCSLNDTLILCNETIRLSCTMGQNDFINNVTYFIKDINGTYSANATLLSGYTYIVDRKYNHQNPSQITEIYNFTSANVTSSLSQSANSKVNLSFNYSCIYDNNPVVSLLTPENGSSYNFSLSPLVINFSCNATDDNKLQNISLYLRKNNGLFNLIDTVHLNGTVNNYTFNTSQLLEGGEYSWNCRAYDNASLSAFAPNNFTFPFNPIPPPKEFFQQSIPDLLLGFMFFVWIFLLVIGLHFRIGILILIDSILGVMVSSQVISLSQGIGITLIGINFFLLIVGFKIVQNK